MAAAVVREVWEGNLEKELQNIMSVVERYPCIAVDTEFPGIVTRPVLSYKSSNEYHYKTLKCNVDLLKVIQVGFTFADENGNFPPGVSTWQFNFKFSLNQDLYSSDSIELLQQAGIDFKQHEDHGIDPREFSEILMVSGVVLNDEIKWIAFHSGFDFAYLLRMLTGQDLPDDEGEFFNLLSYYFPKIYDIKYLMRSCPNLNGGLQKLANDLEIPRVGPEHQAGSDALLTAKSFFTMRRLFFENEVDDDKFCRIIYGLGDYSTKIPLRIGF